MTPSSFVTLVAAIAISVAAPIDASCQVTTNRFNNSRTGATLSETILTTSNVTAANFGKLFSLPVDGQVYAQPLYLAGVSLPQKGLHNVVYVATEHNSVYAFDADSAATPLWRVSLGTSVPWSFCCMQQDLLPEIGITSTPVIDAASGTLYVVAESLEKNAATFTLHALDVATGLDKVPPVVIEGSVSGNSFDSERGLVTFAPKQHYQRPGLLLANGNIYIGFGSHQEKTPSHGWLFSYNATTLAQTAVVCLSPDDQRNGIWQGGAAPVADASGNLYLQTGSGLFDANTGGRDYGDSIVRIKTSGTGMAVTDYFAPSTQLSDNLNNRDLGSSGPLLIPGTSFGVSTGKEGKIYVFDTRNLGHFSAVDKVVQEWQATSSDPRGDGFWGSSYAFYNSTLYTFGARDSLKAFAFNGSKFDTVPLSQNTVATPAGSANAPAMSISANGLTPGTGIVWASFSADGVADGKAHPGVLYAFDAADVSRVLWTSNDDSSRDAVGNGVKWNSPTVADGKVYLGTYDNRVNVYGLLPETQDGIAATSRVSTQARLAVTNTAVSALSAALVQQASGTNSNGQNTLTVTLGKQPASGNVLILFFDQVSSSQTITSISGATWTQIAQNYASNIGDSEVWVGTNPTSSTITITGSNNFGGFQPGYAIVSEFSGISSTLDGAEINTSSGSWPVTTGSLTTANAGDILLTSALSYNGGGTGATVSSPWALLSPTAGTYSLAAAYQTVTVTGTYSAVWNGSGTPQVATIILALKTAGGGGSGSITPTAGTPQSATVSKAFATALQATVKDANNNALSGVTVTFTAPNSGASATFAGSSTATAVTNSNGIATAPALTANSQAGAWTLLATAPGITTAATFNLTNTAASGGTSPTLTGSGTSASTTANLTTEGSSDWVHWGDSGLTRKAGVSAQLSDYKVVGSGNVMTYSNDPRALSWTDGTPIGSGSNNNGIYINSLQNGFSFTAVADSSTRVLTVHVGGWMSGGTLTAHLSDKSAADYVDVTSAASGQFDRNYTLTYRAASAAQTLTVSWIVSSGGGNVTFNGAAVSGGTAAAGSPTISATAGTPQNAMVNKAFATALQATVRDANNNALSGVTVTFTAPSSGATGTFAGSATATAVTNASGVANAPALTANGQAGAWTLLATAPGVTTAATFNLTNLGGSPASITATAGTPQTSGVNTAFATGLQATVKDSNSNAVSGVTVTFTAPTSGASATFGTSATAAAVTNSSGIAVAPALTANSQAGSYTVTATVAGVSASASFALTNSTAQPATITATAGNSQSATINSTFATALEATVKDSANHLLSGVVVTFTAPSSGASATFSGSASATATTNSSGVATVAAPKAGTVAGAYTITATAGSGVTTSFSLTNLAGAAASISATAGTPQSTTVNTAFGTALQTTVKDASNNPVSGASVTFTTPSSGAGAAFSGSSSVVTNASGIATAPALIANAQVGSYTVTAAVSGVSTHANFALTNTAVPAVTATLVQQASGTNSNGQNTLTVTLAKQPTSGNVLILFFDQVSSSQTITSISGATWTRVAQTYASNIGDSEVWVGTSPTSSTITITGSNNFGGFQPGYSIVSEFSGISSMLDGAELNTASGSWPVTTGSLTTANPGDILLTSALSYNGGGTGATVSSPWALLSPTAGTYSLAAAYQVVTATGTYSAVWNGSGTPQVATIILALKTGGGGSGTITPTTGTPQSATVKKAFATVLQATVKDANNKALSGVTVTFTAPASGASGTFAGSTTATAVTNASGIATAPAALTANSQAGAWTLLATAPGTGTAATFNLTNLSGAAAGISATAGTPQTASVNTVFATGLQATVKDSNNNAVSGVTVTFTAPASGARATFGSSATATAVTNASGIAVAPALTANGQAGSYAVTATAPGVSTSASFALTNSTAPAIPITLVQQAKIDSMINIQTESLPFASANTAGNWIGVAIFGGQSNTHVFTVTDSNGNTYKQALTQGNTHDNITLGMYYAENIKGGTNQVTVVPDTSGYIRIVIVEYSGLATVNSLDVIASAQGSSVSPNSGTVTTLSSGDLLWGASASADAEPFAGTGYTLDELVPAAPGTALTTEDQIQASAGAASASLTFGSSKDWTMGLVAVRKGP